MKKTASEIEADIYKIVKNSILKSAVSGDVFLDGLRPENSDKEDVIVSFMTGIFDIFHQEGKVNINVYVPDKESSGILRKNTLRCREIERVCQVFCDTLQTDGYQFRLGRMIQVFNEKAINQHYVNVQLNFKYNFLNR
ncbi:hypothetical protein [Capnocytophaga sp.]|uniref:hypothetical protein n=1 Tax=Capnocytophaga sp. TaxID=44737 RepID=UPI0026DD9AFD|nr:hypothetical protein [Capnocytophaga sp.]MDO5106027.1 hypothetical protein [Capnocytophaga sp.]